MIKCNNTVQKIVKGSDIEPQYNAIQLVVVYISYVLTMLVLMADVSPLTFELHCIII